ncbi:MAG: hypothetical protein QXT26_03775 [Thermoproteota archaeon]
MCLLKVYVEDARSGERTLIAGNVAYVSLDGRIFKIHDVDGVEKTLSGVNLLMIDALNSILVFRIEENLDV